jgi:PadR family transcriptional regulator PadR
MGGRRRMRRRGGRRGTGILEPALLLLLHHGPAHGYTLLEQLGDYGLGDLNSSIVYRALRDMEARGWVRSSWDTEQSQGPPRRIYYLTSLGDEVLGGHIDDLQRARGDIDNILGAYARHMDEGEGDYH